MHRHGGGRFGAGPFWAAATGCEYVAGSSDGDPGNVLGEVEGMGIALCPVPEQKTVKHRVHIDVHTDSVDTVLALGATVAPGYDNPDDAWTVLLDPEGGELCAFVRDDVPAYRTYELCVDSVDGEHGPLVGRRLRRRAAQPGPQLLVARGRARHALRGLMVFDPSRSRRR